MTQLRAEHLAKQYKSRWVVNDVSLKVGKGEIVGLLGPNGAGKTTSFYMIVGLVACERGQVFLGESNITRLPMHARARLGVGYLPQEPSIFRKLSVYDNIYGVLELRRELKKVQRKDLCASLLSEFNLTHIEKNLGASLSGGERRRVEIARALAMEPDFILLDEPFAGVDPISVEEIKRIIRHLKQKGIGILITDHNVRETLDICERGYIVNEGHILCEGTPQEILNNKQVREVYLGQAFDL